MSIIYISVNYNQIYYSSRSIYFNTTDQPFDGTYINPNKFNGQMKCSLGLTLIIQLLNQKKQMISRLLRGIIISLFLLSSTLALNSCSIIQFSDYSFDLTGLTNQMISIVSNTQTKYVKINFCLPIACEGSNDTQKAFILRNSNNKCQALTINTTIRSNFNYIDSNQPNNGIRIDYLPYISSTTVTTDNFTNITTTRYTSSVQLFCESTLHKEPTCIQTVSLPTITQQNITYLSQKVNSQMVCTLSHVSACPSLSINNFWEFLITNRIWFAIVIWMFAVFQLFMGYFVIRLTILLYGICTGAVFGIVFSAQNYTNFFYDDNGSGITTFIVVLSFLMGLLFGIGLLTLPKLGYVNIGMWDAIIFTLLLQNGALYSTGSMLGFYITLGISCLIMTAISLLGFRKFIILSTPFISSFWIIRTLGFILPYYPNEFASSKLFAINSSTPWQFYLYLASIIVLSILGCTFQFCWYKRKGRDGNNDKYYLQDDHDLKDKFKKLLEFKDIRNLINAGKEEVMFLKNLVVENQSSEEEQPVKGKNKKQQKIEAKPKYIEMAKMSKLKKQNSPIVLLNKDKQQSYDQEEVPINSGKKIKKIHSSESEKEEKKYASKEKQRSRQKPKQKEKQKEKEKEKQKQKNNSGKISNVGKVTKSKPKPPSIHNSEQQNDYDQSEEQSQQEMKKVQIKGKPSKK